MCEPRDSFTTLLRAAGGIVFMLLLIGCASRPEAVSRENDRLRHENLELSREIDKMKDAIQRRDAELRTLEQQRGPKPAVEGAHVPHLSGVRFGRYSGPLDTNADGRDDTLRIYLRTIDQDGRFMLVAGEAHLQAAVLTPGQDPRVVIDKTFSPDEFARSYHSGITGTHFTLEASLPADLTSISVKLTFTDAATGSTFSQEQSWPVQ